ncbi:hypothetical protein, partial [Candidatus Weimeria sp. HCP3S3_B5]|uniref:hypothetical protein n=1 Tax=Candidatus Weimeria sp. HCP3S3_B5 TaxID=3438871 RepID=UPI003F8A3CF9
QKPLTQGIQPASWQSSRTRIGCVAEATTYPHKLMKPQKNTVLIRMKVRKYCLSPLSIAFVLNPRETVF